MNFMGNNDSFILSFYLFFTSGWGQEKNFFEKKNKSSRLFFEYSFRTIYSERLYSPFFWKYWEPSNTSTPNFPGATVPCGLETSTL